MAWHWSRQLSPIIFGLLQNCPEIISSDTFRPKMLNLGLKNSVFWEIWGQNWNFLTPCRKFAVSVGKLQLHTVLSFSAPGAAGHFVSGVVSLVTG